MHFYLCLLGFEYALGKLKGGENRIHIFCVICLLLFDFIGHLFKALRDSIIKFTDKATSSYKRGGK